MERSQLRASCPSGNPDYQYYLKPEADDVMDAYELRIRELECVISRLDANLSAYMNDANLASFRKQNQDCMLRIMELEQEVQQHRKTMQESDNSELDICNEFGRKLVSSQKSLDADAGKILEDNLWDMVGDTKNNEEP